MAELRIDRDFFNIQVYAVYSAINRLFGKEAGESVVSLFGELAWNEIKKKLIIENDNAYDVIQRLAIYFKDVGYITGLDIQKVNEYEFIITFQKGAAAYGAVMSLKAENAYPPHYLTTTMSAALKDICKLKIKLVYTELDTAEKNYEAREKWILIKTE